jgi:hypothetical protein
LMVGSPLNLDDDLKQMRIAERVGMSLEAWAEARGVSLVYAEALPRFLDQD